MRERLRDPVWWTDASQLLKTVAAVVAAWLLAVHVFHVAQAFLAPWAALLTVHATVYRSVRRGAQQVGATVIGVLAAFAAGTAFGPNAFSLAAAVLVCLVAGSMRGLRSEATTAAATALVVLTAGYSDDSGMLLARLLDTAIVGADAGAVAAVRRELDGFAAELPAEELEERLWPLAGALLVNLRTIVEALDVVADAQPVRVPAGVA